jgi:hypothetical protein
MDELTEHDIQYFPLDFDALQKGDSIPPDRLEKLTETVRGTDVYNLAVLALRERIIRELRDREKHFTVAMVKGSLRVLTDSEAALYNARAFKAKFRGAGYALRRAARVDQSRLEDGQRKEHERNLITFGKMLQAAKAARRAISATPHERTTPGLPGPQGSDGEATSSSGTLEGDQ